VAPRRRRRSSGSPVGLVSDTVGAGLLATTLNGTAAGVVLAPWLSTQVTDNE
jgi:hypothetical protein